MTQNFLCPRCHLEYTREEKIVDERIQCRCGIHFWVVARPGMCIAEQWDDPLSAELLAALQQMLRPKKQEQLGSVLREMSPRLALEISMRKIQQETYETELMHENHVVRVLDIVNEGKDAWVRRKKDTVQVYEAKLDNSDKIEAIGVDYSCLSDSQLIRMAEKQTKFGYEAPPRDWQIKIMDENDERSGLASGNAG